LAIGIWHSAKAVSSRQHSAASKANGKKKEFIIQILIK
jgi:hypothetical protein